MLSQMQAYMMASYVWSVERVSPALLPWGATCRISIIALTRSIVVHPVTSISKQRITSISTSAITIEDWQIKRDYEKFAMKKVNKDLVWIGVLYLLGLGSPTLDGQLPGQVQVCKGGFICLICGNSILRSYNMRRHMREIHDTSDEDYHCSICESYFINRKEAFSHISILHRDWEDWKMAAN